MPDGISFLPNDQRKKEQELSKQQPAPESKRALEEMRFTIPKNEEDDIDIIEIDEGDVDEVLAHEPLFSRFYYRVTTAVKDFWQKVNAIPTLEPPPKLPPQFFTPPVKKPSLPSPAPIISSLPNSKLEPSNDADVASSIGTIDTDVPPAIQAPSFLTPEKISTTPKPVIQPFEHVPRRVRVIRRVRKPLRVSFVSSEDLRSMRIDVGRRKFTFALSLVLFAVVLGWGTWYAKRLSRDAQFELVKSDAQIMDLDHAIFERESRWSQFASLEPKLIVLKKLLDAHASPTHLFDLIEASTLPSVSYQSIVLTPDHKMMLSTTADSFESAAAQVELYAHAPFVQDAEAGSYVVKYEPPESTNVTSVDFQIQLTLAESAFRPAHASSTTLL